MRRVLKPGGQLLVLEFSHPVLPFLKPLYDLYSFRVLPLLGKLVAKDEDSYRYLAESIRMHPDQETLLGMLRDAGLEDCRYHNLIGRHRRRAPRLSLLDRVMLTQAIENLLNRNLPRSPRAQRAVCSAQGQARAHRGARASGWRLDLRIAGHLAAAHQGSARRAARRTPRSPAVC